MKHLGDMSTFVKRHPSNNLSRVNSLILLRHHWCGKALAPTLLPLLKQNLHTYTHTRTQSYYKFYSSVRMCRCSLNYSSWIKHIPLSLNASLPLFIFANKFELYFPFRCSLTKNMPLVNESKYISKELKYQEWKGRFHIRWKSWFLDGAWKACQGWSRWFELYWNLILPIFFSSITVYSQQIACFQIKSRMDQREKMRPQ